MPRPSGEDLLGYVLGALDADEQQQVQNLIDLHPELEEELLALKAKLAPLEYIDTPVGPPPGLARRTCQAIAVVERSLPLEAPRDENGSSFPQTQHVARQALKERREARGFAPARRWSVDHLSSPRRLSLSDVAMACSAALIVGALLMPALATLRFNSRMVHCQSNLISLYHAMSQYALDHNGDYLYIPRSGRMRVVGMFAPILREYQYVDGDHVFYCPGLGLDRERPPIPTRGELERISCPVQYAARCKLLCGDYGCNLGYVDDSDRYVAPNVNHSLTHVILADAPSCTGIARMTRNHNKKRGNGIFGNGAVFVFRVPSIGEDAIYLSDRNQVEPGRHPMDTVVACGNVRLNLAAPNLPSP